MTLRLEALAVPASGGYSLTVSAHGINTGYFAAHKGRPSTDREFEESLALTPAQRRLADSIVSSVRAALEKQSARSPARRRVRRARANGRHAR